LTEHLTESVGAQTALGSLRLLTGSPRRRGERVNGEERESFAVRAAASIPPENCARQRSTQAKRWIV